jgi:uncharacterized membrane protein YGL010W
MMETSALSGLLARWYLRHQNRLNLALHVVGIPATVAAAPLAILGSYGWAAVCFGGGYVLQFAGHLIEGNKSGEELLFRRLLKLKS